MVDSARLDPKKLHNVLPNPLPDNVKVKLSPHAGYFYWPRVQVVLDGMQSMMQHKWDFVLHLSESDYPVHSLSWIRETLSKQRRSSFIDLMPRCKNDGMVLSRSAWYWWKQRTPVASCSQLLEPRPVYGLNFPMEEMEAKGFKFAQAPEWMAVTRELAEYALSPELASFRRLVSMHAASDEIFWATLVLNIPNFTQDVAAQKWYMRWSDDGHSPDVLTESHEQLILSLRKQYLFLRKVQEPASTRLLSKIDSLIDQPDEFPGPVLDGAPWQQYAVACPTTGWVPTVGLVWPPAPPPFQETVPSYFPFPQA